jgi:hypothetical protein
MQKMVIFWGIATADRIRLVMEMSVGGLTLNQLILTCIKVKHMSFTMVNPDNNMIAMHMFAPFS